MFEKPNSFLQIPRDRRTQFHWLGSVEYRHALGLQNKFESQVRSDQEDQILGLEHPYVITLGKRSRLDVEVPEGNVVWVDRGGEATLHSEGQLVIYPIVNLANHFSVRQWVEFLLVVTEKTLSHFGIQSRRGDQAGLWTERGKIAFAGIRVRNRVSTHGLSINVRNHLELFGSIKSCGVSNAQMDKMEHLRPEVQVREVFEVWSSEFERQRHDRSTEKALIATPSLDSFPEVLHQV